MCALAGRTFQPVKVQIRLAEKEYVKDAIKVIHKIHPYEEPLYHIIPLLNCMYE